MPIRIVYKACRTHNRFMYSLIIHGWASHQYVIGEKTRHRPFCGPLTAFNSIQSALDSCLLTDRDIILKCRALESNIDQVFIVYNGKKDEVYKGNLPKGTVLCTWIEPIEEVSRTTF
jgi:hypothetical protein